MKIKSWLKSSVVDGVRNDCVYSGHRTLKLAVSQEGVKVIFGGLILIHESYFDNFWVEP